MHYIIVKHDISISLCLPHDYHLDSLTCVSCVNYMISLNLIPIPYYHKLHKDENTLKKKR